MDTFKDSVSNKQISWLSIVLVALLLLFWVLFLFKGEHRFTLVLFSKDAAIPFSENYGAVKFPFHEKNYEVVIAEKGRCMSSGWLLLLVPAVFLFSLVFPRKLLKKSFKKRKK
ncbi:hypothetical protein [Flavobacterium sp. LB1P62]|uniref:hypothetical protein n=1 Tax=unclassified Flavobacterium TaxID=196869 RepID=UPI003AAAFABD